MSTPKQLPGRPAGQRERTRPTRAEVRARILAAAATVFAQRGLDGASLDDVAAAAGFTKGAVYSNFAGKDELILALMDEQVADRLAAAVASMQHGGGTSTEQIRALGEQLTRALVAGRDWQLLFLEFWTHAARDPAIGAAFAEHRRHLRDAIAFVLADQTDRLDLHLAIPPAQLATVVLALSNGLAIERLPDPSAVPDQLFGTVLQLLLQQTARAQPPR